MSQFSAALRVLKRTLMDWWYDGISLALINVIWVLAVLTIILAPPATLAVFFAANQMAQGRGFRFSDFVEGFRRYFLLSYGWGLLNVGAGILIVSSLLFYGQLASEWGLFLFTVVLFVTVWWLVVQFYTLPYLIEQERKNILIALRNGLFTAFASPLYTLVLGAFVVLILGLSIALVIPIFLGVPCLIAVLANRAVRERLIAFGLRPSSHDSD